MTQSYTCTRAADTWLASKDTRLSGGLAFLEATQADALSTHAGGWPSTMSEQGRRVVDWNCFTTSLVCECLSASLALHSPEFCERVRHLQKQARQFVQSCRVDIPDGAFRFWSTREHPYPGPDLDDTALAQAVLADMHSATIRDNLDALSLFGPYRVTRGKKLHPISRWAEEYPGVFAVWMADGPALVDICATANVVRCLSRLNIREVAGYQASLSMLAHFLQETHFLTRWTHYAPYYCLPSFFPWLCSLIPFPAQPLLAEEIRFLHALKQYSVSDAIHRISGIAAGTVLEIALTLDTARRLGAPPAQMARELEWLCQQQENDGGWPGGKTCCNLNGVPFWTSRALTTALMIVLLVHVSTDCKERTFYA